MQVHQYENVICIITVKCIVNVFVDSKNRNVHINLYLSISLSIYIYNIVLNILNIRLKGEERETPHNLNLDLSVCGSRLAVGR